MKKLGFLLLLLASLTGCRGGEENAAVSTPPEKTPPVVTAPKPQPVDPFAATYHGNLPCSKCQGSDIETILRLTNENRYFLTIRKAQEERHFSGQYRVSTDKRFIQLDDSADTLTFLLGGDYLEARLPDGSTGKRQFPDKKYQLAREILPPEILPAEKSESLAANI